MSDGTSLKRQREEVIREGIARYIDQEKLTEKAFLNAVELLSSGQPGVTFDHSFLSDMTRVLGCARFA